MPRSAPGDPVLFPGALGVVGGIQPPHLPKPVHGVPHPLAHVRVAVQVARLLGLLVGDPVTGGHVRGRPGFEYPYARHVEPLFQHAPELGRPGQERPGQPQVHERNVDHPATHQQRQVPDEFIVADDAVVVFNGGGSYLLAKAMHEEIKKVTDLPVKYLVYENAQGHAVFGGSYWKEQGVEIIAHENTPAILQHTAEQVIERAKSSLKDKYFKSRLLMPDRTFKDQYIIPVKGKKIVLMHFGNSHSPDDIQLWLPEDSLLISGDFAFNERLLPILEHTNIREWIESWDKIEALNPEIIIPGHGGVTDLQTVTYYTKDYLSYMLEKVEKVIEEDGGLTDAYNIDQSAFMHWKTYRELSLRNSATIFKMLEFE